MPVLRLAAAMTLAGATIMGLIGSGQAAYEREQGRRQEETSRAAEINLGWVELRQRRFEKALAQFERHPDDAEALRGAAEALSALKRRREAIAALERALVLKPEDRAISWRLREERGKPRS